MCPRRAASRILLTAALAAAPVSSGCGAQKPARSQGPTGKIEALREEQEKAQERIEAEGRRSEQQARRAQEAALAEAERERDDRKADGR